jgi:hypothetical protein
MSAEFDNLGDMNIPGVLRPFWSNYPGHFQRSHLVRKPKPLDSNSVSFQKLNLALRSAASLCMSSFSRRPNGAKMYKEKSWCKNSTLRFHKKTQIIFLASKVCRPLSANWTNCLYPQTTNTKILRCTQELFTKNCCTRP